ncbi:MAG: hypothetical protein ACK530_08780 [Alphaproteobacteria bacterium]
MTQHGARQEAERRWIVLGTDGRHVSIGRDSDPSPEEIEAAEAALLAQGHGGWLAVTSGEYWSRRARLDVLEVRRLGAPATAFAEAAEAFQQRRHARLAEIA